MKKVLIFFAIVAIGAVIYYAVSQTGGSQAQGDENVAVEVTEPEVIQTIEEYIVQEDDTFTTVLEELDFEYSTALEIVEATADVFDFTNVRINKTVRVVSLDGVRTYLEYEPNKEDIVRVDLTDDNFSTEIVPIPYELEVKQASVTINESMFLSGLDAGLSEVLIIDLAEVLAWEIDFATQVQSGDSFTVVYEQRSRNGVEDGVGNILAATFTNNGNTSYAYRYENTAGEHGYYDQDGASLIRPFLKAPLAYNRISSGYTHARFHPVTQRTSPHLAIDYAAPTGTPIRAVGDGVITQYGWFGGYGNYVDIRHNGTYQTQYAHLSAYADGLTVGSSVTQGQIIGYVGSTGFSTGPHLHYQVKVNGQLVNPLEVEFPKGEVLEDDDLALFKKRRTELDKLLEN